MAGTGHDRDRAAVEPADQFSTVAHQPNNCAKSVPSITKIDTGKIDRVDHALTAGWTRAFASSIARWIAAMTSARLRSLSVIEMDAKPDQPARS